MGGCQMDRVRRKLGLKPVIGRPIALLTSQLRGGKATFMEFARLAVHIEPALACIVESYDSLNPVLRRAVSIDELCVKHGFDPYRCVTVAGEAAMKFRNNSAILMIALSMPEVINRTIKQALKPEGTAERKFLLQHASIIPTPHGPTINVSSQAAGQRLGASDRLDEIRQRSQGAIIDPG